MSGLQKGTAVQQVFPNGAVCSNCGHGWREFANHQEHLEQLTVAEARAALGANSHWLNSLRAQLDLEANANR
jgi:hypothetical protein